MQVYLLPLLLTWYVSVSHGWLWSSKEDSKEDSEPIPIAKCRANEGTSGVCQGARSVGEMIINGDQAAVEEFMASASANERLQVNMEADDKGMMPLHYCAQVGDVKTADLIWRKMKEDTAGYGINETDTNQFESYQAHAAKLSTYPLVAPKNSSLAHIAAENGHTSFLHWLALHHDDKEDMFLALDADKKSPPAYAIENEKMIDASKWLITYFDVDLQQDLANLSWSKELLDWYEHWLEDRWEEVRERQAWAGLGRSDSMWTGVGLRMNASGLPKAREVSANPPVISLYDLIPSELCDEIIATAKPFMATFFRPGGQSPLPRHMLQQHLEMFDADNDTMLNKTEIRWAILNLLQREASGFNDKGGGMQVNCGTVAQMLQIDRNGDGQVDLKNETFDPQERNMTSFNENMNKILQFLQSRLLRTSAGTWLPLWHRITQKVHELLQPALNVPVWVLRATTGMQVVHYTNLQHYGNHNDGHVATLTLFFSTSIEGGETTFPYAPMDESLLSALRSFRLSGGKGKDPWEDIRVSPECTENQNCCQKGCRLLNASNCTGQRMTVKQHRECIATNTTVLSRGTRVKVEKGNAVLWYNHEHAPGERSQILEEAHHCSCSVVEGEKWSANIWFNEPFLQEMAVPVLRRVAIAHRLGTYQKHEGLMSVGDSSHDIWFPLSVNDTVSGNYTAIRTLGSTRMESVVKDFNRAMLGLPVSTENQHLRKGLHWQSPAVWRPGLRSMPASDEIVWGILWWGQGFNLHPAEHAFSIRTEGDPRAGRGKCNSR
eukprot:gnl/MRDRNA2_/MRDRNA2_76944_c0_seq2.p1 gnl/MRDRNA2_/MRDRNA2_76944_c0~~gnl/MRDRNA2_/MRDRNA2_76944_c0_seq2.p1  ORF type:complete len:777 (+),score=126.80 gnl/MRDRNA2_/MRDRNA2_76944_c0_seq2:98-2428(+)